MTTEEKKAEGLPKQAWGERFVRFDASWTKLEARLCAAVLVANVLALCVWVTLSGMSSEGNAAGVVFRALFGAAVLGGVVHKVGKTRLEPRQCEIATTVAVLVGLATGKLWSHVGVSYASNFQNWIQNASVFLLFGGLRTPGLATRLTLWLALLGASIATSQGKHINVDVIMRFLTPKMRVPVAIVGWTAAACVCLAGAWGFFDHIAIQSFHVPKDVPCPNDATKLCDPTASQELAKVEHDLGNDMFLLGRQMSLDWMTFPKVLSGQRYDQYLHPADWNAWMNEGDWRARYKEEDVKAQMLPTDMPELTKMPAVNVPGGGEDARGLLTKDIDFIFVFGLVMIALRFLLRSLLVLSGHVTVDPDAAHGEPEVVALHEAPVVRPAKEDA
jgi:Tripartite ATP-independent periplasmic transporters, DctQ component